MFTAMKTGTDGLDDLSTIRNGEHTREEWDALVRALGSGDKDLMRALDALVSIEHLGHAWDWDESSKQDELSRIALREAVEAGVITERERRYMLGSLAQRDTRGKDPDGNP